MQYRSHFDSDGDWFPYRLTYLYPDYVDDRKTFLCPFDASKGTAGARKDGQFQETWETGTQVGSLGGTLPCSFMYEFSGAECSWGWAAYLGKTIDQVDRDGDGKASWGEVKWVQYKEGDTLLHSWQPDMVGWPASLFPVVRCFWEQERINDTKEQHVVNQSMEGRPYWSAAHWEDTFRN
jgi:hypothetical protein